MPQSTHDLTLGDEIVVKRYVSWSRGEAEREFRCLSLLSRLAPDLAPAPIEQRTRAGAPELVMSRLPGEPLGDDPLTTAQLDAVAAAMGTLHSLPPRHLAQVDERISGLASMLEAVSEWVDATDQAPLPGDVRRALTDGRRWLRGTAAKLPASPSRRVLANGDGNLGNYLWDGQRCRIVDFEDGGVSEIAYEVADLVEHITASVTGAVDADDFIARLGLDEREWGRVHECRRLFAVFWLLMLLPGSRAHDRNPPGTLERQAERLHLLLDGDARA